MTSTLAPLADGSMSASETDTPDRRCLCATARLALVGVAAALVVILAADGSLLWRTVRPLVVIALTIAAWKAIGARPQTMTALAVGLLAVPVGIGIGIPHLLETGWSIFTIAGTAALVGGLTLLTCATVWWCRSARRWSWPLRASAVLVACALMTWTLGQAIAATNAPPTELGAATPADYGLDYRDVEFEAADGVTLSGWYVPTQNQAAVVLLHGAGSTRADVLEHAAVLARHGYGVLLYDARGHGRSEGRAMDFGWYGDADIAGAVAYLSRLDEVDPLRIGAVGMSMGGEQAIGAAGSLDGLRAVVAEGATNRVAGDKGWLSDEHGWRGAITERIEAVTYWFTDLLTDAGPPITLRNAAAEAAPVPMLLIAAGNVADEVHAGDYIRRASPATVDVWIAPDTGHTDALRVHPEAWSTNVLTFLDEAL